MNDDQVHVGKELCFANLFHFLLACSQAAIFPFLTLYFRQLGLTATQVGVVFGSKAILWMFCAPVWTACAKFCNKKKVVLALSLLMLMASTLVLSLVPPASPDLPLRYCASHKVNGTFHLPSGGYYRGSGHAYSNDTDKVLTTTIESFTSTVKMPIEATSTAKIPAKLKTENDHENDKDVVHDPNEENGRKESGQTSKWGHHYKGDEKEDRDGEEENKDPDLDKGKENEDNLKDKIGDDNVDTENEDDKLPTWWRDKEDDRTNEDEKVTSQWSKDDGNQENENGEGDYLDTKETAEGDQDDELQLNDKDMQLLKEFGFNNISSFNALIKAVGEVMQNEQQDNDTYPSRQRRETNHLEGNAKPMETNGVPDTSLDNEVGDTVPDTITKMKQKWKDLSIKWGIPDSQQTFVIILALVIIGELLSAPVEKLADDCWFEYLDIIDALERYGTQKMWLSLGFLITAPVVAALVDHTPCLLPHGISHFLIHFFVFTGFITFTFLASIGYPVAQNKRTPKRTRLAKGMRVLCGDIHAMGFTFTMVIVGAAHACISNILFWQVMDVGGTQLAVGAAIATAALSEMIMLPCSKMIVTQLTHQGAVVLALLMLAGQLLFYSFLWAPWFVLAAEALNGFTTTLLWTTVQTYPDFRINPFIMDRSGFAVINALYLGVGGAVGSLASGLVYDTWGFSTLFQAACVIVIVWCMIFLISQKCITKKMKVRYAKLLQEDNNNDSSDDDNTIYDDDWLEIAMKKDHRK